jgi:adenylate cyclase
MAKDETATLQALKKCEAEVIEPIVKEHSGRIFKRMGDGFLIEFSSAVDSVDCAIAWQKEIQDRECSLKFRIGINLGDNIADGDDIYGDGVNIAARLESLAQPGCITISDDVFRQVRDRLEEKFHDLGEQDLKNIPRSVHIWEWLCKFAVSRPLKNAELPLPEKPSIAVLPFTNIKGQGEEGIFSDGLTQDIIISLSKISELLVIARNSSFSYKEKQIGVQQIGKELGVKYILEGSVRKAADNLRITAQLVEAETGHHIWADRFDRQLQDVFSLQDEITLNVLKALQVKLTHGEQVLNWTKGIDNIDVYLKWLKGRWLIQQWTKGNILKAREIANEIIELAPDYSKGYRLIGSTHMCEALGGWSSSPKDTLNHAVELFQTAIKIDESETDTYAFLGYVYTLLRKHEKALIEGIKGITYCPSSADAYMFYGMSLSWAGNHEDVILMLNTARRLNPISPPWYDVWTGHAYRNAGKYKESALAYKQALKSQPEFLPAQIGLTVDLQLLGFDGEAKEIAVGILKRHSKTTIQNWVLSQPFKFSKDLDFLLNYLMEIELIEKPK